MKLPVNFEKSQFQNGVHFNKFQQAYTLIL